jgi:hypothetical protein
MAVVMKWRPKYIVAIPRDSSEDNHPETIIINRQPYHDDPECCYTGHKFTTDTIGPCPTLFLETGALHTDIKLLTTEAHWR